MNLLRLGRAEYLWQPLQLPRRAFRALRFAMGGAALPVRFPWGHPITIDPRESIGRSIAALSVVDLLVTEAIWRLLDDGESCADVGANIGAMTSAMAARLSRGGTIRAFEPVPTLADALRSHVAAWRRLSQATIHVRQAAVADGANVADLHLPVAWAANHGIATLSTAMTAGARIAVECCTLDGEFAHVPPPRLIKLDVEGAEARVLRGATGLLSAKAVRDLIFEEYGGSAAPSITLLRQHGFTVFRIDRRLRRPVLLDPNGATPTPLDVPTYLATLDPDRARQRFAAAGWQSLRRRH